MLEKSYLRVKGTWTSPVIFNVKFVKINGMIIYNKTNLSIKNSYLAFKSNNIVKLQ